MRRAYLQLEEERLAGAVELWLHLQALAEVSAEDLVAGVLDDEDQLASVRAEVHEAG